MKLGSWAGSYFAIGLALVSVFVLNACVTSRAASKTEAPVAMCSQYNEKLRGVWHNNHEQPVQRFIFASNANGYGCYGWFDAAEAWGISRPGSFTLIDAKRDGPVRVWEDDGYALEINLVTGHARFSGGQRAITGRILRPGEAWPQIISY
ncbi:MAG: hypothetical protein ACPGGK_16325 [Pikeienuella sp.]